MIVSADLDQLAAACHAEACRHPPRTPQRRAAAHLWVALTVPPARSVAAARRAVRTFGDETTQADALQVLERLAVEVTP